ncbi:MAG: transglycosylase SLT domain-containing protein [Burkholderiales bacterium]
MKLAFLLQGFTLALSGSAVAGTQIYEPLAIEVQAGLKASIADKPAPRHGFDSTTAAVNWLTEMSQRLQPRMPNFQSRLDFLRTVHYESTRAGLDPQLVLAVIQVESNFRKYAVSRSGARGYMQVMPFWMDLLGRSTHNLFNLRTNLRYGCVILKYYLVREKGDLFRALSRYNGSLGKPRYANLVLKAMRAMWRYDGKLATTLPEDPEWAASHFGKSLEIESWIASAAASGSGARRIGLPTTM